MNDKDGWMVWDKPSGNDYEQERFNQLKVKSNISVVVKDSKSEN